MSAIMAVTELEVGMETTRGLRMRLVRLAQRGDVGDADGTELHDNSRRNKWWVWLEDEPELVLACIDALWDNEKDYGWRKPPGDLAQLASPL